MILPLLLACVPPDPPVRSFVELAPTPSRDLPFQTERQAWQAVIDALEGAGIPKVGAAELAFSEQVPSPQSSGNVVVTRRFLSGPGVAREHLAELGLQTPTWSDAELWEAYQAFMVGSLALRVSEVVGRERKSEREPEAELARAAALERATLAELARLGQVPAGWLDAQSRLVCALAASTGTMELGVRCAASKDAPPRLADRAEHYEPLIRDVFAGLLGQDPRDPGQGVPPVYDGPEELHLRMERAEDTVTLTPRDQRWSLEIQQTEDPELLRAVLVLPLKPSPEQRGRSLDLVNALNRALGAEDVIALLTEEGLLLWVRRWPVESERSSLALARRFVAAAQVVYGELPGVLAGSTPGDRVAGAVLDALIAAEEEAP